MQAGERSGAGPRRRVPPPGAAAPAWADPASQLKTEMKPGTCGTGGGGAGGRRAQRDSEGQKSERSPRPRPAGCWGRRNRCAAPSSSINLLGLRSVNKKRCERAAVAVSERKWRPEVPRTAPGPAPAGFAPWRSASPRPAASSSRGAQRSPAGHLIGYRHCNSGHCESN